MNGAFVVVALLLGCDGQPTPPSSASGGPLGSEKTITETAVARLNGHRVPLGTVLATGEYTLPDASTATGPVAMFHLPAGAIWVGAGSEFVIGDKKWRVKAVNHHPDRHGELIIQPLQ